MRQAIVSDIHSNLEALEAVLAECERLGADAVHCLGDIVGYGASPNECVGRVRERALVTLAGNHDHAAVDLLDSREFNEDARRAVSWTARALTPDSVSFLRGLPMTHGARDILYVHASPGNPAAWDYILRLDEARRELERMAERLCFFGHTHKQAAFVLRGRHAAVVPLDEFPVNDGGRYLVNVGSVGQPRDGDPRAAFTLYDDETELVRFVRVEYDIETAARKIADATLPSLLAFRLWLGR